MDFSLEDQFTGFVTTPQIFAENAFFEYPLFPTSTEAVEISLPSLKEPKTKVLGKRMEYFFHYYISHFGDLEVLAHNQQIILNKITLGELDFLLKDSSSEEIHHVELIYKFYLYDPTCGTSEKDHLIGPNRRDSLNRKLERLQKRQFPLLFQPATEKLLQDLDISPEKVFQKMCFKAYIFLPKQERKIAFSEVNPQSVLGYWIRLKDFTTKGYGENEFFSPKKKYWPVNPEKNSTWYSYSEIRQQIAPRLQDELSQLIWMRTPLGNVEKFFVVWW